MEPRCDEFLQRLGHREWGRWIHLVAERARNLERIERVASGGLVDSEESCSREAPPQPLVQKLLSGAHTQRVESHALDLVTVDGLFQRDRRGTLSETLR